MEEEGEKKQSGGDRTHVERKTEDRLVVVSVGLSFHWATEEFSGSDARNPGPPGWAG